jgi:hypothetical protein
MCLRRVFCGCVPIGFALLLVAWGPLSAGGDEGQPKRGFGGDDLNGTLLIDEPTPGGTTKVTSFPGGGGTHTVRKLKVGDRILCQFSYDHSKDSIKNIDIKYHQAGPEVVECLDIFSSDDALYPAKQEKRDRDEARSIRYYVALLRAKRSGRCDLSILAVTKSGRLWANPLLFDVRN